MLTRSVITRGVAGGPSLVQFVCAADAGRVAVERGPLVYCAEGIDNAGYVAGLVLPDDAAFALGTMPSHPLGGGFTVIRAAGVRVAAEGGLEPFPLALVPYYAWNYRGPGAMTIWLPRSAGKAVSQTPAMARKVSS